MLIIIDGITLHENINYNISQTFFYDNFYGPDFLGSKSLNPELPYVIESYGPDTLKVAAAYVALSILHQQLSSTSSKIHVNYVAMENCKKRWFLINQILNWFA